MTQQQPLFANSWRWKGLEGTSSARFSDDRKYRYELRRTWRKGRPSLVVCALNPSIADEGREDPTVRRLISFADRWGMGSLILVNAFALRSTDPKALKATVRAGGDPVGTDNDRTIATIFEAHKADKLLLAWGGNAKLLDRGRNVAAMAVRLHGKPECFGLTDNGHPFHCLYLPDVSIPHLYLDLVRQRAEEAR